MLTDRETRRNIRYVRFGIAILVLFIMSAAKSCDAIRYSLGGETTRALVINDTAYSGEIAVRYQFEDVEGNRHKGQASFSPGSWSMPADRQIDVVYLRGNPEKSMPVGKRSALWPCIFLGMTAIGVGWIVAAYRKASQGRL